MSEEQDDSDYKVEYDRDIVFDRLMKQIERLIKKEPVKIQNYYDLIKVIRFDRNKVVTINNKQYCCNSPFLPIGISDQGLKLIQETKFENLRKRYNILHKIFEVQDSPAVLEYIESHRNYFAVWAYAALFIDHEKFEKFLYHVIINYKAQKDEAEDIWPMKMNDIEPITHSRFLYTAGK